MRLSNTSVPLSVDFSRPEHYVLFIFQIVFATSTVLVAVAVIISILGTRELLLQNRFIFMLNTSVCDALVGLSVYYLGLFDVYEGFPSRNGTYGFLPALLGVNMLTFMFAQFDRYVAVCHPFLYTRFLTRRVIVCVNVYSWVHVLTQTIILNLLPPSKAMQMYVVSIISLQVIVFTKVVMTIRLYVVAQFQVERDPPGPEKESNKESLRIIIFVVISFLVLWCPSFANIGLRWVGRGLSFKNQATNIFAIMARFSAVCTPAVYMWGSPSLRQAMRRTMRGRGCPHCNLRVNPRRAPRNLHKTHVKGSN